MKEKQVLKLFFLVLFVSSTFLCMISFSETNTLNYFIDEKQDVRGDVSPKASDVGNKSLGYSNLYQNDTVIRRVFESIKFEVNISEFWDIEGNYTEIQFSFTNNTVKNLPMTNATLGNFTFIYTPEYNAPIGFQNVTFLIYNGTESDIGLLLNNQSTQTNFTIIANVMVGLNSSQYARGEFLNADLMLKDDISLWNISITNDKNGAETEKKEIGVNIYQFQLEIDTWFTQAAFEYYVRVNVSYSGQWASIYFGFFVENSQPIIVETSVKFNPTSVYRTSNCRVELNVTDYEDDADPSWINVSFVLEDPEGETETYTEIFNNHDGTFRHDFIVAASKAAGYYNVNFTAKDRHGGTDSYYTYIYVLNNPPKINSYTINDMAMNASISINYGEDLIFGFNVSDTEGIAYITVALLNQDNEWYNITRAYIGNMTITVRTVELIKGNWYVYIFLTDTDGYTIGLDFDFDTAPQEIKIIEDLLSIILPWVALFIGLGIGIAVGMGFGISILKKKASKSQETTPPKGVQTGGKQEPKRTEPKTVTRKIEQPTKREAEKKVIEKPVPEKETPQRKIKRKLK